MSPGEEPAMPAVLLDLPTGATVACTDTGQGQPILLLHGVCMSQKFFARNIGPLAAGHRVVAVDFRGHGGSPAIEGGHTIAQYARDVRAVIDLLGLHGSVAVGWSMGSLVIWEYLAQYASDPRLAGVAIVSQGPSDLTQPGWPHGIADLAELHSYLEMMQDDFSGFFAGFVPMMFKNQLAAADQAAFLTAISAIGANAGSTILADQTLRDYRDRIAQFTVPHLLVWGRDEKVGQLAAADWLHHELPASELHVFEDSGHCPMWEEPGKFNALLTQWVAQLPR
jgi:pimeloyl-ACP methyl ester carboxylesterase